MEQLQHHNFSILAALLAAGMPLLSFCWSALRGKQQKSGYTAIMAIAISMICSIYLFSRYWNKEELNEQVTWFRIGDHSFMAGILLNNLSVLMLVLISSIALLVHIYSTAYMKGDPGIHRYWMYLSLFCAAMLGLVMADNLLLMYMCWELVGFASYLLIGFWFTKESAVQANKKAFIINRIGDLGFLTGIALIYAQFGTLDIKPLFSNEPLWSVSEVVSGNWLGAGHQIPAVWLTVAGLAFFVGAIAKSAQFPLHTWLPDAMEGPTSVSSLIHAATMVAAGVFLLARVFPLFNETVLTIMAIIGSFTALMAATIALTQHDLKKILAFSTISQLGFMISAVGIGIPGIAMFHLVTHAIFKCLLFLAAGVVIHEMQHANQKSQPGSDPQDIRQMGGLKRYMPITTTVAIVGAMALSGLPLTSGYLSKDALLISAFEWADLRFGPTIIIPISLLISSVLTSFYIARLIIKVFFGKQRIYPGNPEKLDIREAFPAMLIPMIILGLAALFPFFSANPLVFEHSWLLEGFDRPETLERMNLYHTMVPAAVNLLGISVIYIAWRWYAENTYPLKTSGFLYRFSYFQWYIDRLQTDYLVRPVMLFSAACASFDRKVLDGFINVVKNAGLWLARLAAWVDQYIVDGLVNGIAGLAFWLGNVLRRSQNGRVQYYMLSMFIIVLMVWLFNFIVHA
ncbi:NADH dehydrogenase subunit L [bacterium A37T11]|nr:NADH dehydrogenase subunit L [bacterium A37T11]